MKNNSEFIRYFAPLQRQIFKLFAKSSTNLNEADDLLQEVAVIAWNKFESFDESKGDF